MSVNISIPITNHDTGCVAYYYVEYKLNGEVGYNAMPQQTEVPIEIYNLQENTIYDFRITRTCCDRQQSNTLEFQFDTTQLTAPENFTATPSDGQVQLDWDAVTNAAGYTLERADDDAFETNLTALYDGTNLTYTDTDVSNGTIYYYRLRAYATAQGQSDYATLNATPNI